VSRDHHDWVIAADHPALSGHFPGDPILPGVAILAAVLDAIEATGCRIGRSHWRVAKFHSPARPGDALVIDLDPRDARQFAFSVRTRERLVADGTVAIEPEADSEFGGVSGSTTGPGPAPAAESVPERPA